MVTRSTKAITGRSIAEYGERIKNYTETWGENLDMEESQLRSYAVPYPSLLQTELPITFQAPFVNAKNYWNDGDRRTGQEYEQSNSLDFFPRPISDSLNSIYGFMNHFFGSEPPPRRQNNYPRPPSRYPEYPPYFTPKPVYLPGPKPVRATVVKLEPPRTTVTYPAFTDYTTTKHYPQFVKLLNDVLIENAYKNQQAIFETGDIKPVLEKPEYNHEFLMPTTYKPRSKVRIKTTPPTSIQDQLPPLKHGQDTRIPYISESTQQKDNNQVTPNKTRHNPVSFKQQTGGTTVIFPEPPRTVPPLDLQIDVRSALRAVTKRPSTTSLPIESSFVKTTTETPTKRPTSVEIVTHGEIGITIPPTAIITTTTQLPILEVVYRNTDERRVQNIEFTTATPQITTTMSILQESSTADDSIPATTPIVEVTTESQAESTTTILPETTTFLSEQSENKPVFSNLLSGMERLDNKEQRGPFPKKLHSQRVTTDATNSADYVTDLTLRGLASRSENVTTPRSSRLVNMASVIGYEIGKLNATAPPFADDLSLDAKILRDTNWDGFQPPIPTTTESIAIFATIAPEPTLTPTTTTTPPPTTSFPETTESAVDESPTQIISTRMTQSVSKSYRPRFAPRVKPTQSDIITPRNSIKPADLEERHDLGGFMTDATPAQPEVSTRTRQYRRRTKSPSFTPRPRSLDERTKSLQFGSLTRPFNQRKRANATLTFKRRSQTSEVSSEETIASQETTKSFNQTRRNLYRQRNYPSQLKRGTSSTEEPLTAK